MWPRRAFSRYHQCRTGSFETLFSDGTSVHAQNIFPNYRVIMTRVRQVTRTMSRFASTTGKTLWLRLAQSLGSVFSSHAAWSVKAWTAVSSSSHLHDNGEFR